LKLHGIAPAPKRSQNTTWKEFIQSHLDVLAGIDFITVEGTWNRRYSSDADLDAGESHTRAT
jgi:hypothetical protein